MPTPKRTPSKATLLQRERRAEQAKTRSTAALTIAEFGAEYGPCRASVYNMIRRGELEARKVGRLTVIPRAEAERWFAALPSFESAAA